MDADLRPCQSAEVLMQHEEHETFVPTPSRQVLDRVVEDAERQCSGERLALSVNAIDGPAVVHDEQHKLPLDALADTVARLLGRCDVVIPRTDAEKIALAAATSAELCVNVGGLTDQNGFLPRQIAVDIGAVTPVVAVRREALPLGHVGSDQDLLATQHPARSLLSSAGGSGWMQLRGMSGDPPLPVDGCASGVVTSALRHMDGASHTFVQQCCIGAIMDAALHHPGIPFHRVASQLGCVLSEARVKQLVDYLVAGGWMRVVEACSTSCDVLCAPPPAKRARRETPPQLLLFATVRLQHPSFVSRRE